MAHKNLRYNLYEHLKLRYLGLHLRFSVLAVSLNQHEATLKEFHRSQQTKATIFAERIYYLLYRSFYSHLCILKLLI